MLKLLYLLFKQRFNKLAFSSQSKKNGFENMESHFVDSKGMKYYRYKDDFNIPILRFQEIQKRLQLFSSGLSDKSILMLCEAMKKALNKGNKPDIAEIGFLIKEIEKRANIYIDTDLLMDTACLMYIREDENPAVIDWIKHDEKVKQLTSDSKGGLYDFFYLTGLMQYLPFVGTTQEEFNEFYQKSEVKMKALKIYLQNFTTG
jgi:hypothetical protein